MTALLPRTAGLALVLVSFSAIPAIALDADTATIRVRVIAPASVTSPVHLELKAADDP